MARPHTQPRPPGQMSQPLLAQVLQVPPANPGTSLSWRRGSSVHLAMLPGIEWTSLQNRLEQPRAEEQHRRQWKSHASHLERSGQPVAYTCELPMWAGHSAELPVLEQSALGRLWVLQTGRLPFPFLFCSLASLFVLMPQGQSWGLPCLF